MHEYELRKSKSNGGSRVASILMLCSAFLWIVYFTLPSSACAQCYRLTDDRGTIHFTNTIYRWINDKGEVYYTNYIVFLSPEKYLATFKEIEPGPPPGGIKEPPQFVQDPGDIMTEMKKRFPVIGPWTWTQDTSLWVIKYLPVLLITKPSVRHFIKKRSIIFLGEIKLINLADH